MASPYSELSTVVRSQGLMERRHACYVRIFLGTLAGFIVCWLIFALVGDTWYQLVTAIPLAMVFAQVALLVHDAGHRQIARSRTLNDALGRSMGTLLLGFSYSWWV